MGGIIVGREEEIEEMVLRGIWKYYWGNNKERIWCGLGDSLNLCSGLKVLDEDGFGSCKGKVYKMSWVGEIGLMKYGNKVVFCGKCVVEWGEKELVCGSRDKV